MDYKEPKLDEETVESAFKQIHYYINLPKHIKGRVTELNDVKPNSECELDPPAHLIEGTRTVVMGKMNIPAVNYKSQFLNKTVTQQ